MRDWLRARVPIAYERLTGRRPWAELVRLRELQWRPAEELEARALGKLRAIVSHAQAHVPYYRDLLRRAAVDPGDIRTLADLSRIPVSRKADLRPDATGRVLAGNLPVRRRAAGSTAGSTGMPFRFFTDRATAEVWLGSYMLFREWANAPFGGTMLWIPGPAHASKAATSVAWMRAAATSLALGERTIRLSDFEPDVAELCTRIRRSIGDGGYAIWGFPSYIARIAAELLESGAELNEQCRRLAELAMEAGGDDIRPLVPPGRNRSFAPSADGCPPDRESQSRKQEFRSHRDHWWAGRMRTALPRA
jgi:phenylacetate-CoA ligase